MRNPISLLAAALVCAAPAFADGFNRLQWQVVAPDSPNDHVVADRVRRACPSGTLAMKTEDVPRPRWHYGQGIELPLYCVTTAADGQTTAAAIDSKTLEYRCYVEPGRPFGSGTITYYFNSGAESRQVALRPATADDFKAPQPQPVPKPGPVPSPRPRPRTPPNPHSPVTQHPRRPHGPATGAKPAPHVVTDAEKKWLTFEERAAYETALASHQGQAEAKRQLRLADYRDARKKIAANVADREGGSKKYAGLTAGDAVVAKEIDAYLSGLDAYGAKDQNEIQLTAEELTKLDAIKDGSGVSQKANYDKEMGAADAKDVVLRHRIAAKYRPLAPSAKPDAAGALTAAEVERLKSLKLYDAYVKDAMDAGGDPAKLAEVNKKYRDKIAAAQAGQPRSLEELFRSRLTGDDLAAFNKDLANAKTDAEKNAVYDKYLTRLGKISDKDLEDMPIEARKPFCDRLKANSKAGTAAAPAKTAHEQAHNIDTGKTDFDRGSKTMTLVTAGASGGESLVASNENLKNAYTKCIALDASGLNGGEHKEEKAGEKTVPPPTGSAKADAGTDAEKPKDPNLFRNLAQAMTGGLFGLILGSFFGGPLVMAGFAVALGAGSYLLSQHFNPPPKKGKGDGDG